MSTTPRARLADPTPDDEAADDAPADDASIDDDSPVEDLAESGLDLSEASDLDADNVLADEEAARVLQAPD